MHRSRSTQRLLGRSSFALLSLSAALPLALFGWTAWDERARALWNAEGDAVRTVSALHEHAAKVLETHELVLAEVSRQVEGRAWDEVGRDAALWRYLQRVVRDLDQVAGIALADGEGRVRVTTAAFPAPEGATVAERDFFRSARDGEAGTYIGPARHEPGREGAVIALSRRLSTPEGGFNGVVHVAVPVAHFTAFWERFAPTVAHVIPLVRSDGQVVARYPALSTPERIGTGGPFLSRALARREGVYRAVSQVDGVERLNAFTRVKDYPLHISFSVETRAVLAAWRERIGLLALYSALAAAALFGMTAAVLRQHRAQRAASERWREVADRLAAEMAAREGAEAALRRAQTLDAVGRLTAGVAHDFNNLLQAIKSGLFLLRKRVAPADAEATAVLDASLQAVDRGAKLVHQLMVFARREELEPRPVDLRALLAGMGELLRKAVGTGVRIEAEVAEGLHPAMVDPTGAELAVLNLAINARDAMEGEGRLTLAARNLSLREPDAATGLGPGDYVVLSVSDTGAGMAREVVERALEPFFTTKPVGKGTGLGLSMVHGFVSQSGGGIRIDSEPGRGTAVGLYLPRAAGAAAPEGKAAAAPAEAGAAGGGATVLLVDDDALGRLATAAALREFGHEVLEARDGGEGLAILGRNPGVALAVTDYAMPGMNGAEFAAAARAARPGLPVVVVTGYAAEGLDDLGRAADAVLRKPFRVEDLDARVRAVLRSRAGASRAAVA